MRTSTGPDAAPPPTSRKTGFFGDLARAAGILAAAAALGLAANALSARPVPLGDPKGPGALPPEAPRVTAGEYRTLIAEGGSLLLDARSERILKEGHPAGGLRATPETLMAGYAELQPFLQSARRVVVLCDTDRCSTGDRMASMLESLGHPGARVFEGGWAGYRSAGLPLEGPTP